MKAHLVLRDPHPVEIGHHGAGREGSPRKDPLAAAEDPGVSDVD